MVPKVRSRVGPKGTVPHLFPPHPPRAPPPRGPPGLACEAPTGFLARTVLHPPQARALRPVDMRDPQAASSGVNSFSGRKQITQSGFWFVR